MAEISIEENIDIMIEVIGNVRGVVIEGGRHPEKPGKPMRSFWGVAGGYPVEENGVRNRQGPIAEVRQNVANGQMIFLNLQRPIFRTKLSGDLNQMVFLNLYRPICRTGMPRLVPPVCDDSPFEACFTRIETHRVPSNTPKSGNQNSITSVVAQ